jgi:pyruvate/2-oxoglutarate dehydrogenase complex dihydrolipoamide acyltransferase (E2) component
MAEITVVRVPDIGDFDGVDVVEVLVAVGDQVAVDDPLITLESDKATMDVPSPLAGEVAEILVEVGATVAEGDSIMKLVTTASGEGEEKEEGAESEAAEQDEEAAELAKKAAEPAKKAAEPAEKAAESDEEAAESDEEATEPDEESAADAESGRAAPAAKESGSEQREPLGALAPGGIDEEAFRRAYASPSVRKLA